MGNGGFYGCLSEPEGVSAWWNETAQTQFVLSTTLLLNHIKPQSIKTKLLLPKMPIGIVMCAFTLFKTAVCACQYEGICSCIHAYLSLLFVKCLKHSDKNSH